jgi:ankyrin repeat protein
MPTTGPEANKELFKAVKDGNVSIVRQLLAQGLDPNGRNTANETPIMTAAEKGNLEIFDLLQQAGADLGARTKNGNMVLFRAAVCRRGNEGAGLEMLRRVMTTVGIGPNQEKFNRVLVLCSAERSPDYLRALVDFGADPNYHMGDGEYALLSAVWHNRPEAVSALPGAVKFSRIVSGRT